MRLFLCSCVCTLRLCSCTASKPWQRSPNITMQLTCRFSSQLCCRQSPAVTACKRADCMQADSLHASGVTACKRTHCLQAGSLHAMGVSLVQRDRLTHVCPKLMTHHIEPELIIDTFSMVSKISNNKNVGNECLMDLFHAGDGAA